MDHLDGVADGDVEYDEEDGERDASPAYAEDPTGMGHNAVSSASAEESGEEEEEEEEELSDLDEEEADSQSCSEFSLKSQEDMDEVPSEAGSGEFEVRSDSSAGGKRKWDETTPPEVMDRLRALEEENSRLRKVNVQLTSDLAAARAFRSAPSTAAAPRMPAGTGPTLILVATGKDGKDLHEIEPPQRFGKVGAFPHAVVSYAGARQYQVEARRPSTLVYTLVNQDGSPASETSLPVHDMLFKLSIHYADDGSEVDPRDITQSRSVDALVRPGRLLTHPRMLENGGCTLKLNFMFSSVNTHPRNRLVFIRMQPSNATMRSHTRLVCDSFAFLVRAKVTAKKDPKQSAVADAQAAEEAQAPSAVDGGN